MHRGVHCTEEWKTTSKCPAQMKDCKMCYTYSTLYHAVLQNRRSRSYLLTKNIYDL